MKRRAAVFFGVWVLLLFLTPHVARAEPRPFDFSRAPRSARLLERSAPWARAYLEQGARVRALSHEPEVEVGIPTHYWLVPLILTGAGLVTGVVLCGMAGADESDSFCQQAMLWGMGAGFVLGLAYVGVALCATGDLDCSEECDEDDELCGEQMRASAARARSIPALSRGAFRARPLGHPSSGRPRPRRSAPTPGTARTRAA